MIVVTPAEVIVFFYLVVQLSASAQHLETIRVAVGACGKGDKQLLV